MVKTAGRLFNLITVFSSSMLASMADAGVNEKTFLCHASQVCSNVTGTCMLSGARLLVGGRESLIYTVENAIVVHMPGSSGSAGIMASILPNMQSEITVHRVLDSGRIEVETYHAICAGEE